jgi:hypothetical protein
MARRRRGDRILRDLRERKYRLQGRGKTRPFIPDSDSEFAKMSRCFVDYIERHAERLPLSREQIEKLTGAVEAFRDALARTMWPSTAGPRATSIKNMARADAEKFIRGLARILRAAESLTPVDREMLNVHEPAKRLKRRECPQIAPVLTFKGSPPDAGHRHILEYRNDFDNKRGAKPHGAARLELFVELVPPEVAAAKKIPARPDQLSGGKYWYLRSFSSSRFEVEFPVMADGSAMLVVYWGRWADASGNYGPFSKTCVARVEGGPQFRPVCLGNSAPRVETKCVIAQAKYALPPGDHLEGDAAMVELRQQLLPAAQEVEM